MIHDSRRCDDSLFDGPVIDLRDELLDAFDGVPATRWAETCTSQMRTAPVAPSVHGPRAAERSIAWALHHGLFGERVGSARVQDIRCGSCAAHVYPRASAEVVTLGAELITWLFLFDDAYGEGVGALDMRHLIETLTSYELLLRTGRMPAEPTPFHVSLAELVDECTALATPRWRERFIESMCQYFRGCLLEYPLRRTQTLPSLLEYRRMRAWSIGIPPVLDLIELANGEILPDEIACDRDLMRLRERTAWLCAWVNDVYSYDKERREEQGDPLNLVAVLAHERGLGEAEAYAAAAAVFNEDLRRFEQRLGRLLVRGSEPLRSYLRGLTDWVHGNATWTGTSRRYGRAA